MYVCMFCEVIVNAPQLIELSALQNTFYSKKEYVCMYVGINSIDKKAITSIAMSVDKTLSQQHTRILSVT